MVAESLAEGLSGVLADISVNAVVANWLYETPKLGEVLGGRRISSVLRRGMLAGAMLSFILRAANHGYPKLASKGAFLRGVSHELRFHKGNGFQTLDGQWRRCRGVAHLWAHSADWFARFARHEDREMLLLFLAHVEERRRMGEAYKSRNKGKPVLDPVETWKVPTGVGLPAVNEIIHPPTDEDLRIISSGKLQLGNSDYPVLPEEPSTIEVAPCRYVYGIARPKTAWPGSRKMSTAGSESVSRRRLPSR